MTVRLAMHNVLIFGLGLITSCKSIQNKEVMSHLRHDSGQPTTENEAWHWREISDDDYNEYVAQFSNQDNDEFKKNDSRLNQNDPAVERMTFWQNKIDTYLRSQYPAQVTQNIPVPKANVFSEEMVNANATLVPICLGNVRLNLKGISREQTDFQEPEMLDQVVWYHDQFEPVSNIFPIGKMKCIEDQSSLEKRIEWHNRHFADCQLSVKRAPDGVQEIIPSKSCHLGGLETKAGAQQVVALSTANYIDYNSGLIIQMTEEEMVAIIAHELGHYYRAHITTDPKKYDFPYKLTGANLAIRPPVNAGLNEDQINLYKKLQVTIKNMAVFYGEISDLQAQLPVGLYIDIKDQIYHLALFKSLMLSAESVSIIPCPPTGINVPASACRQSCRDADRRFYNEESFLNNPNLLFSEMNQEQKAAYLSIQSDLKTCFSSISLGVSSDSMLSPTNIINMIIGQNPPLKPYLSNLSMIASSLHDFYQIISQRLRETYPPFNIENVRKAEVIFDSIDKKKQEVIANQCQIKDLEQRANQQGIGQYTAEQEADEIALEWMNALGVNPRHAIDAEIKMIEDDEHNPPESDVCSSTIKNDNEEVDKLTTKTSRPYDKVYCTSLLNRDWDNGRMIVPVGSYLDPHHQGCFRAYDLSLEISAHKYMQIDQVSFDPEGWKVIQDSLRKKMSPISKIIKHLQPLNSFGPACRFGFQRHP